MVTILDRLKHFTATLGIFIYQLENECGITHGVANKIRKTSRPLLWEKIHRRFPILNIEWLKTGKGDMLLTEHPAIIDGIDANDHVSHHTVNNGNELYLTMNTVKSRIQHFAATLGLSMLQFEKQCEMKYGVASRITEKSYPKTFEKIHRRFPILNIEWLKTGKGDMLLTEHPAIIDSIGVNGDISHYTVNNRKDSASYNSSGDQQLLRTIINKIEAIHVQVAEMYSIITERDAQIAELLSIAERFAGVASKFFSEDESINAK